MVTSPRSPSWSPHCPLGPFLYSHCRLWGTVGLRPLSGSLKPWALREWLRCELGRSPASTHLPSGPGPHSSPASSCCPHFCLDHQHFRGQIERWAPVEGARSSSGSPAGFSPVSDFSPLLGPSASYRPAGQLRGGQETSPCLPHEAGEGGRTAPLLEHGLRVPASSSPSRMAFVAASQQWAGRLGAGGYGDPQPHAASLIAPPCALTHPGTWGRLHVPAARAGGPGSASGGQWCGGKRCAASDGAASHTDRRFPHVLWCPLSPG